MKKMFASLLVLTLMSGTAIAAPYDGRGNQHQSQHQQGKHQAQGQNHRPQAQPQRARQPQPPKAQQHRFKKAQYEYQGRRYDAVRGPAWKAPKGYNAQRHWNRGERLPDAYRNRAYVVDHRHYHLNQPPRGYQWVRVNNDVILVAIASGVISQVVFSMFY